MTNTFRSINLALCLALLSAAPAFTQTDVADSSVEPATTAPVAYVYVQTSKGINLYDAAANGQLTLVKGSPFSTTGLMIGGNGKYFITLGTDYVHSYLLAANGAIGKQVSEIDTQSYAGGPCGTTDGANLDHTGQSLYVELWDGDVDDSSACFALQAFNIAKNTGALSFIDVADNNHQDEFTLPSLTANDTFGYSIDFSDQLPLSLIGFKRAANGALSSLSFKETDPTAEPGGWGNYPWIAVADPTNHLAVAVIPQQMAPDGELHPIQLASYTVASNGNIASTNTWKNMPTPAVCASSLNMSPSGKILAVAGTTSGCGDGFHGTAGLQVFHFNGASPLTNFGNPLTTVPISKIHWDGSNHLYALSASTSKLYVYTVTTTSITEAPGSPYTLSGPSGVVVVPQN